MDEEPKEDTGIVKKTDLLGLPNPQSLFDPQAYEPTGLKSEFQLKPEDLPLKPNDTFIYFGKWVCCVEPIGSNFCVTYDIDRDTFSEAAFIGVDTRAVGRPRKIEEFGVDNLHQRYRTSQKALTIQETPVLSDDTQYEINASDLNRLNLQLIATDGSFEGKRLPIESRRIKLGTFDHVQIDNTGRVVEHIIVPGRSNFPTVVVGDWHQSIISELPILRGLGLLPKQLPVQIDWLDEHTDEYAEDFHPFGGILQLTESERNERKMLLVYPKNVNDAVQKMRKIHCGRAALPLSGEITHITSPLIFNDLAPAKWVDIFSTKNPFIRKSKKPHVLSLDCDFFDYWCRRSQDPSLQAHNFDDLTRYLVEEKGLDFKQYDAVMIYTSPKYCKPEVARKVVDFTLNSLLDSLRN